MSSFLPNKLDKFTYLCTSILLMKISEYIAYTIDRLPNGYVFTYYDFNTEVKRKEATIKALN